MSNLERHLWDRLQLAASVMEKAVERIRAGPEAYMLGAEAELIRQIPKPRTALEVAGITGRLRRASEVMLDVASALPPDHPRRQLRLEAASITDGLDGSDFGE